MRLFPSMWGVPVPELQPRGGIWGFGIWVALTDDAVGVVHVLGQEMSREVTLQDFI